MSQERREGDDQGGHQDCVAHDIEPQGEAATEVKYCPDYDGSGQRGQATRQEVEAEGGPEVGEEAPQVEDGAGAVTSIGQTEHSGADKLTGQVVEISTEYYG